ncbi:MAG: hypothetical protein ABIK07_04515 [Planctomycetota bacterium]|uniref:hypothetical protein n=1 Tax=uncultured Gimesia sp. TaxID=1678688 RepID=UPI0026351DBC|nr:hypothetical protein [uncultured Gimesia sp.]
MKLLSCCLLLSAFCLLPGCGSDEAELNSGEITPALKEEMEKEKAAVFESESAHRAAQEKQAQGKK